MTIGMPPSDWYPDPGDGTQWRYWDGAAWTHHTHRPHQAVPPPPILTAASAAWYPTHVDQEALRYWDGVRWTEHVLGVGKPTHSNVSRPRPHQRGMPSVGVAILLFALACAANLAVTEALLRSDSPGGEAVMLLGGSFALWAVLLLGARLVVRWHGREGFVRDLYITWSRRDWLIGLLASFAARGAAAMITILTLAAFADSMKDPQIGQPVEQFTGLTFVAFAFVAVIGAPVVEEIFFRGLIQTRLVERLGAVRGIAITSVMFGAAHLIGWVGPESLVAAAAIAGSGAVLGYVRHRTGRLGTSIAAHAFFNLFVVVVVGIGLLV